MREWHANFVSLSATTDMQTQLPFQSTSVVPKVGDTAPLGSVRNSKGRWSRNGRLGGDRRPS